MKNDHMTSTVVDIPMQQVPSVAIIRMPDPPDQATAQVQEKTSSKFLVPITHMKPERKASEYSILKELKKKAPQNSSKNLVTELISKERMAEPMKKKKKKKPEEDQKYKFTKKSYAQFGIRKPNVAKDSGSSDNDS